MIRYLKRGKDASAKAEADAQVRKTVEEILRNIESQGDKAVRAYSKQFDQWDPADFKLSQDEIKKANQFFESVFQDRVLDSPEFQSRLGYKSNYDQWDDITYKRSRKNH